MSSKEIGEQVSANTPQILSDYYNGICFVRKEMLNWLKFGETIIESKNRKFTRNH